MGDGIMLETTKKEILSKSLIYYINNFPINIYTPFYVVYLKRQCNVCQTRQEIMVPVVSGIEFDSFIYTKRFYSLHFIYDLPNEIRINLYKKTWSLNLLHGLYVNKCSKCMNSFLDVETFTDIDINDIRIRKLDLTQDKYLIRSSYSVFPFSKEDIEEKLRNNTIL